MNSAHRASRRCAMSSLKDTTMRTWSWHNHMGLAPPEVSSPIDCDGDGMDAHSIGEGAAPALPMVICDVDLEARRAAVAFFDVFLVAFLLVFLAAFLAGRRAERFFIAGTFFLPPFFFDAFFLPFFAMSSSLSWKL